MTLKLNIESIKTTIINNWFFLKIRENSIFPNWRRRQDGYLFDMPCTTRGVAWTPTKQPTFMGWKRRTHYFSLWQNTFQKWELHQTFANLGPWIEAALNPYVGSCGACGISVQGVGCAPHKMAQAPQRGAEWRQRLWRHTRRLWRCKYNP